MNIALNLFFIFLRAPQAGRRPATTHGEKAPTPGDVLAERAGQSWTPRSAAMPGVPFTPVLVRTTTVTSPGLIWPLASSSW